MQVYYSRYYVPDVTQPDYIISARQMDYQSYLQNQQISKVV